MEAKKKIIKKILTSRRLLTTSKLMEDTKLSTEGLFHIQMKYLQLLKQLRLLNTVKISLASERITWEKERTQSFWETDGQGADESSFKNYFRMSRKLFYKICELLPGLGTSDTKMREAIPLEKMVAIALYTLGSTAEYRTIANMFGVTKASVCKILLDFCAEIWRVLAPMYLNNFPMTREKIQGRVQEFEALGYPQCMGALDGCHIEIQPFQEDATDYYNYKGWYSVVLLALVDARCRFIYVNCGSPGCCTDSQIFQGSSLKKELNKCNLLADLKKRISDVDVPVHIIGDSAFRLSDILMKPYPFQVEQSHHQTKYNCALTKSLRVAENAFSHLKARFIRIGKGIENAIKNVNFIILSCCVLHNFLNENNDKIYENWLQSLELIEASRSYPESSESLREQNNAERIRSAISTYLSIDEGAGDGEKSGLVGDDNGEEGTTMDGDGSGEIDEFMS